MKNKKNRFNHNNYLAGCVEMSHGAGGRATNILIQEIFQRYFANELLAQNNDQACFNPPSGRLAMSTDSHVITPLFFPGGDIGSLAVNGTLNDLAMAGARPLYLAAAFILEAGLPLADLDRIVASMAAAALAAQVWIITGDTKVVERGKGDGVFITTTGIGIIPDGIMLSGDRARPGDMILLNGQIGDHGMTILAQREHLGFTTDQANFLKSDTVALYPLVADMLKAAPDLRCLRDPTRGGLATTLNELAKQSNVGMVIQETAIPISSIVRAACELIGIDPLYVANEGKLIAICPPEQADQLLTAMRAHPLGRDSMIIGKVIDDSYNLIELETSLGGTRVVDWLTGEQLPRIC